MSTGFKLIFPIGRFLAKCPGQKRAIEITTVGYYIYIQFITLFWSYQIWEGHRRFLQRVVCWLWSHIALLTQGSLTLRHVKLPCDESQVSAWMAWCEEWHPSALNISNTIKVSLKSSAQRKDPTMVEVWMGEKRKSVFFQKNRWFISFFSAIHTCTIVRSLRSYKKYY